MRRSSHSQHAAAADQGTNDWKEYRSASRCTPTRRQLCFGVLLAGTGKVWADDLRLLVDGKPVWDAPKVEAAENGARLGPRVRRGLRHRHQRASRDADREPRDARQDLGLSQVSPSGGDVRHTSLGLRTVPRAAQQSLRPATASRQGRMLRLDRRLGPLPPCERCAR